MKISGLDDFGRSMEELQKAAAALDGEITNVNLNPTDPASIEQAIQQVNDAIDERIADYAHNEAVVNMADEMKERYREAILEKAAAARMDGEEE